MKVFVASCPMCGSQMLHDDTRNVMVCSSCGTISEGDEISDEKYLDMADSFRKQKAYDVASNMYSAILKKEPQNFRALNGHMLCECRINSLLDISTFLNMDKFIYTDINIDYYKRNCKYEHRAYF